MLHENPRGIFVKSPVFMVGQAIWPLCTCKWLIDHIILVASSINFEKGF